MPKTGRRSSSRWPDGRRLAWGPWSETLAYRPRNRAFINAPTDDAWLKEHAERSESLDDGRERSVGTPRVSAILDTSA